MFRVAVEVRNVVITGDPIQSKSRCLPGRQRHARGVAAWKNRYWGLLGRAHATLVALTGIEFVWFLDNWNLLGFRL